MAPAARWIIIKELCALSVQVSAVTQDDVDDEAVFDADDVTSAKSTIMGRYAVLYDDTLGGDDLICCFDFGSDKSSDNGDFKIQWHAEGIINLT